MKVKDKEGDERETDRGSSIDLKQSPLFFYSHPHPLAPPPPLPSDTRGVEQECDEEEGVLGQIIETVPAPNLGQETEPEQEQQGQLEEEEEEEGWVAGSGGAPLF